MRSTLLSRALRGLAVGTAAVVGATTIAFATPAQAAPVPASVPVAAQSHSQLGSVGARSLDAYSTRVAATVTASMMRATSLAVAKTRLGMPYLWGAAGPYKFDCSGLTQYVWKRAGKWLPHSSRLQYDRVRKISARYRQPGDLVFFFRNGNRHVGIYAGSNMIIHAPGTGKTVRRESLSGGWFVRNISGYGRVA